KFIQLTFSCQIPQKGVGCWQKIHLLKYLFFALLNLHQLFVLTYISAYISSFNLSSLEFYQKYSLNSLFIVFNISLDKNFFNHRWRVLGHYHLNTLVLKKLG
ncbi:hypothetical protein D1F58_12775, partial [Enterococcus faecium]|nr:hypothetical protein [Enterococcus faecium]